MDLSALGIHMIQLMILHPNFILFGSAGIVNADFPFLVGLAVGYHTCYFAWQWHRRT